MQRFNHKVQQSVDVQDAGYGLADLLHKKSIVVADRDLIEKTVGRIALLFDFGVDVPFLDILGVIGEADDG